MPRPRQYFHLPALPDGRRLGSIKSGLWQCWDAQGQPLYPATRDFGHISEVHAITATSDGKTLVSFSPGADLFVWDRATGRPLRRIPLTDDKGSWSVRSFALSSDGRLAAAGGWDYLAVYDVTTGRRLPAPRVATHAGRRLLSGPRRRLPVALAAGGPSCCEGVAGVTSEEGCQQSGGSSVHPRHSSSLTVLASTVARGDLQRLAPCLRSWRSPAPAAVKRR